MGKFLINVMIFFLAHLKEIKLHFTALNDFLKLLAISNFLKNSTHLRPVSDLREFLATESHLKMVKNAFYFTVKALYVLKIFKYLTF